MGIYEKSSIELPRIKLPKAVVFGVLAIIVVLVLWIAIGIVIDALKIPALQLALEKYELKASGIDTSRLTVIITNTSNETQSNVRLEISAATPNTILINSKSKLIEDLKPIASNESRQLEYLLRANPTNDVLPGDYILKAKLFLGKEIFEKEFRIKVVK